MDRKDGIGKGRVGQGRKKVNTHLDLITSNATALFVKIGVPLDNINIHIYFLLA